MITLNVLTASGRLSGLTDIIASAHRIGVARVEKLLPLADVDVVVADDPNASIPEIGVGGYAPNAHRLDIYIDPEFPNLIQDLESKYVRTLAHELHHCARWNGCGYGKTLFEAIVSEGLADHFDQEVNDTNPLPWSIALTDEQVQALQYRLLEESFSNDYDHSLWFFGTRPDQVPRWAGYTLGHSLAKSYMEYSGKKASELVAEPAQSFYSYFEETVKRPVIR